MNEHERIVTVESIMELLECPNLEIWQYIFLNNMAVKNIHTIDELCKIKRIYDAHIT